MPPESYESDRPFPTIQAGEILCPEDAQGHLGEHHHLRRLLAPGTGLVALRVRHNFWHRDATGSLIWFTNVYTTATQLSNDILLGKSEVLLAKITKEHDDDPY